MFHFVWITWKFYGETNHVQSVLVSMESNVILVTDTKNLMFRDISVFNVDINFLLNAILTLISTYNDISEDILYI